MPAINLNQNILSAEGSAQAGDVAEANARASLDFRGNAQLKRGLDLELGVGVMGKLDVGFSKFLAAGAQVDAVAEAGLRGQIQQPLNLFDEAGMAVRLRAYAKAGVRAKLFVGLSMGDFIQLARQDPQIEGLFLKLLVIFLEEMQVVGGVRAEAAFSAMAMAQLVVTGSLLNKEGEGLDPGFTISGKLGAGIEAGTSVEFFLNLGVKDPRRWIRRSVDVTVDETVAQILQMLDVENQATERLLARSLRAPAKIAFRSAFEIGMTLGEEASALANAGPKMINRSIHVILEELQRILLEAIASLAVEGFQTVLSALGAGDTAWEDSIQQRHYVANKLRAMPDDPFALEHVQYWTELINGMVSVATQLGGKRIAGQPWVEHLASLWTAVQLALASWQRVSHVQARASLLGIAELSAAAKLEAFKGATIDAVPPPDVVSQTINTRLGRPENATLEQEHLVAYLLDIGFEAILAAHPELIPVFEIVAGPDASPDALAAAGSTILTNIGAFVQADNGRDYDAELTLRALVEGLEAYIDVRLSEEFMAVLYELSQNDPTVRLYLDEVLLPTMKFSVRTLFDQVLNWGFGHTVIGDALTEGCSSVFMKLSSRSLVVTADVLMHHVMSEAEAGLLDLDSEAITNDITRGTNLDREFVREVMEDTIHAAAFAIQPLPDNKRKRIRQSLYGLLDPVPKDPNADLIDHFLKDTIGADTADGQALLLVADDMSSHLLEVMERFLFTVLLRIGERVGEETLEAFAAWIAEINRWLASLWEDLMDINEWLGQISQELLDLAQSLAVNAQEIIEDITGTLLQIEPGLDLRIISTQLQMSALPALTENVIYQVLPGAGRKAVEKELFTQVERLFTQTLLPPLLAPIQNASNEADALLGSVRGAVLVAVENDSTADIANLVRVQLEERLIDPVSPMIPDPINVDLGLHFTYSVPIFSLSMEPVSYEKKEGFIGLNFELETASLISELKMQLKNSTAFDELYEVIVANTLNYLDLLDDQLSLLVQKEALILDRTIKEKTLEQSYVANLDFTIQSPEQGAIVDGALPIQILFTNMPDSFMGMEENEMQRLQILINQTSLKLETFSVRIVGIDHTRPVSRRYANLFDEDMRQVNTQSAPTGLSRNQRVLRKAHLDPQASRSRSHYVAYVQPPEQSIDSQNNAKYLEYSSLYPTQSEKLGNPPVKIENSLLLEATIPSQDLTEGVNTLTVILTDGRDQQLQKTVVFLVPEGPIDKDPEIISDRLIVDISSYPTYLQKSLKETWGHRVHGVQDKPKEYEMTDSDARIHRLINMGNRWTSTKRTRAEALRATLFKEVVRNDRVAAQRRQGMAIVSPSTMATKRLSPQRSYTRSFRGSKRLATR